MITFSVSIGVHRYYKIMVTFRLTIGVHPIMIPVTLSVAIGVHRHHKVMLTGDIRCSSSLSNNYNI